MLIIGLEGTYDIADRLAQMLRPGDCVGLKGDLGAGKTTLTEHMIQKLHGGEIGIISPTFNVLQSYDIIMGSAHVTIWHYDLYRIENPIELEELALDEAFDGGIAIIEWPEIAQPLLPEDTIYVTLDFGEHSENRNIRIESSPAMRPRLYEAGLC